MRSGHSYYANMQPLIACLTTSYGPYGALAAIENVGRAGLDAIELPIRSTGSSSRWGDSPLITTDSASADLAEVDRMLAQNGVRVASCLCLSGKLLFPEQVQLLKRKLDLASHFGVKSVVSNAGDVESCEDRERLLGILREVGDYADRLGITVCLDTARGLCVNHREMLETMQNLGHPRLRINFDPGMLLYLNDYVHGEVALAKVCHLVKHVHLKDTPGGFGQWHFGALGTGGAVDFLRIYQIMRDVRFPGPYSIDIGGIDGEPPLSLEEHHQRVVESVLYLEQLGYLSRRV